MAPLGSAVKGNRLTDKSGGNGSHWLGRIQGGAISGLMAVTFSISNASLVTSGVAPEATSAVIGMSLIGTAVLCTVLGALSGARGLVSIVQDVPGAALGAILAIVVAERATAGGVSTAEVVVLCLAASVSFALAFFLIGALGVARLMRFVPRPVLAAFLAGMGYLVFVGALGICAGGPVTLQSAPSLLSGVPFTKLLVAVAVAAALFVAMRLLPASIAIAGTVLGAVALFHLAVAVTGASLSGADWFTQVPETGLPWPPATVTEVRSVDLSILLDHVYAFASMVILGVTAVLINVSALEVNTRTDLRLDKELKILGTGNLVAAGLGGLPGYHGLLATLSAQRIAKPHRSISFIAAGVTLAAFFFGNTILAVLPLPILAGFMLWIGLDLIHEWLIRETRMTRRKDGILIWLIFAAIVVLGPFEGTLLGVLGGALLFVLDYSRLDPVRAEFSGDLFQGAEEMSARRLAALKTHGRKIAIQKIQGFLFFGTAHRVRERIKSLLERKPETRYLILDFEGATGLDATAVMAFQRISDDLEAAGVEAFLTGLPGEVWATLTRSGLETGPGSRFQIHDDLNAGMSAAERAILAETDPDLAVQQAEPVGRILEGILGDAECATRLGRYLERLDLKAGETLVTAGEAASDIFFVEDGALDVLAGERRIRVLGPGSIVGEIAYYQGGTRTATVTAKAPTLVWRLSDKALANVLAEDPDLSSRFHAGLARMLANRVDATTRLVQVLNA